MELAGGGKRRASEWEGGRGLPNVKEGAVAMLVEVAAEAAAVAEE